MRESFIQEMRTLGYDEAQMIFDINNAQGDQSALKLGTRTIMLECGKSVLDLKGDERNNMTVQDLLGRYRQKSGKELDNDRMLLTGE